jgi:ParB/RepB/Spo0J family partition protein
MKTATSKKSAKTQTTELMAKANNADLLSSPALRFVPLDLIETAAQVRTEFNQESIEELASDIKARGMLQPVLLRPLANGKFLMIAGERRLRAARFAELGNIPALIGEVDDDTATLMQLAENVHREELSIEDECQAIKKLYDNLGSLAKVANVVKKSIPWCSKRYSMTQEWLHYSARNLLDDGITEDLELLKAYSTLCGILSYPEISDWNNKIRAGSAGRNEVRAALKTAKENKKAKESAEKDENHKISHAKPKKQPPPPAWTVQKGMHDLDMALTYADNKVNAEELLRSYTDAQRAEIEERLNSSAAKGSEKDSLKIISELVREGCYGTEFDDIDIMAMIVGYSGKPFIWMEFLAELQCTKE